MRLRFREVSVWKYSMVAISKIIEEAVVKIDDEGVRLRAIDPSGVALVDFFIPRNAFYEYEITEETSIGLNMDEFAKILRRARRGDELLLNIPAPGRVEIGFEGKGSRRFIIPTIELSYQEIPEISFEESFRCKLLPKLFKDITRELESISDTIELHGPAGENTLVIRAESELAEAEVVLSSSSGALLEYESTGEARSKYTVDYISDIVVASQAAEILSLGLGIETPLRLTYELPEGGRLQFYVAPRSD
ncbi:MAG: DNA polymerase sliding clamp [Desulfurococcaceae archaeon]